MLVQSREKMDTIKDLLGNRPAYIETVKMFQLNNKEKEIFLRAYLEIKKGHPSQNIIDAAYAILVAKSFIGNSENTDRTNTEEEIGKVDNDEITVFIKNLNFRT